MPPRGEAGESLLGRKVFAGFFLVLDTRQQLVLILIGWLIPPA